MPQDSEILTRHASEAKTHVENAVRWSKMLQNVITYIRTDHVGMVRGDGDLTRYMNYLMAQTCENAMKAERALNAANVPDELPF